MEDNGNPFDSMDTTEILTIPGGEVLETDSTELPDDPVEHMVVAEDDATIRAVVQAMAEHVLPGVVHASHPDGLPALDHLHRLKADRGAKVGLVFSDQMMPGMKGLDLYRAVRSTPGFERTPFVIASALMPGHDRHHIDRHVAADPNLRFLEKPFGLQQFTDVVRDVMGTRSAVAKATRGVKTLR